MQGCTFFCEVCDSWCFRLLFGSINAARINRVLLAQAGQVGKLAWLKMPEELSLVQIGIRQLGMKLSVG